MLSIPYGSAVNGSGVDVAVDSKDNVYVIGFVAGAADFGSGTIYGIGYRDTFLVSYAPDGTLRWVKRFGDQLTNKIVAGTGVAIDSNDNVVIVGEMAGDVDFGGGVMGTGPSGGPDQTNLFIASYTSGGAYRFANNYSADVGGGWLDVAVDASAAIYVGGIFTGTATLGSTTIMSATQEQNIFIAGFSPTGVPNWAKRLGSNGTDMARSIEATPSGNLYLVGRTMGMSDLGNGPVNAGSSSDSAYVTSFTSTGTYRWAHVLFGPADAQGVAIDASGNVYVTGDHTGGSDTVPGSMSSSSPGNVFLQSYDASGTSRWSWTLPSTAPPSTATSEAFATVSNAGNLYTAGDFDTSLDAGFGPMTTVGHDIFLASYQSDGTPRFAQKFGGSNSNQALGVAVDSVGRCYMTGNYTGSPNYGDGPHAFSSSGGYYLLRYVP